MKINFSSNSILLSSIPTVNYPSSLCQKSSLARFLKSEVLPTTEYVSTSSYAYLDPKSVLKLVAQLNESLCLFAQQSNGSKEVQRPCPDGLRTTDFLMKCFSPVTENRSGWTEEAAKEVGLYFL